MAILTTTPGNLSSCQMIEAARDYCNLIEGLDKSDPTWLDQVTELLPRLHAAVTALGSPAEANQGYLSPSDLDGRFELFTRLRALLGERDPYWLEYDAPQEGQVMSGSLADDLTDIFCELKYGLYLLEDYPEEPQWAVEVWCDGFRAHWGQHLIDAQRHLYALDRCNQLHS